ncbi:serine hydrolase [Litchfieldella rifensis]|uniref:beta-lactamase n=1 Tax=Litchfieldella rifensis TaxID=762643 RepID=A0ABV7LRC4_9GAMM
MMARPWRVAALVVGLILPMVATATSSPSSPGWREALRQRLEALAADHPGELGVYVKDMHSGETLSFRGDEVWYLASLIKVPVAIAVLREVERGELALDSTLRLEVADYVDGAGDTNWQPPGSELRIDFLLEQMLTASDNTAADMLMRHVGLVEINRLVQALVPEGLGPISTLIDVRHHVYRHLHPRAFELDGMDFITLQKAADDRQRVETFRELLGLRREELQIEDLDSAFAAYYTSHLNAGWLSAYGRLLEALVEGRALSADATAYLLATMRRTTTGEARLKAGLPSDVGLAHKTGTQHRRACDAGIAERGRGAAARRVIIVACARGSLSTPQSEALLAAVGAAVAASGVLEPDLR